MIICHAVILVYICTYLILSSDQYVAKEMVIVGVATSKNNVTCYEKTNICIKICILSRGLRIDKKAYHKKAQLFFYIVICQIHNNYVCDIPIVVLDQVRIKLLNEL